MKKVIAMPERITITIKKELLGRIDKSIDKNNVRNRSHAIERLIVKALGKTGIETALLLAGSAPPVASVVTTLAGASTRAAACSPPLSMLVLSATGIGTGVGRAAAGGAVTGATSAVGSFLGFCRSRSLSSHVGPAAPRSVEACVSSRSTSASLWYGSPTVAATSRHRPCRST